MNLQKLYPDLFSLKPVAWGRGETPLEYHPVMSDDWGVQVYLKREDMIDDLGSGHKIRKFSYILADAILKKATMLITSGSVQSNQCRTCAIAGTRIGLKVHLVYSGDKQVIPSVPTGNYLITTLFHPEITWNEKTSWSTIHSQVEAISSEKMTCGERPYVIPPGASSWPGICGSIALGFELISQLTEKGISPDYICAPAGSCGTCVGIKIACELSHVNCRVYGICIAGTASQAAYAEHRIFEDFAGRLHQNDIPEYRCLYYDGARGGGYDEHFIDELDMMIEYITRYQILLDPNYMFRTMKGMRDLIDRGTIEKGKTVVCIHTGGQFGVFAETPSMISYWKKALSSSLVNP